MKTEDQSGPTADDGARALGDDRSRRPSPRSGLSQPTEAQKAQETSLLIPVLADFGTTTMLLGVGIASGSMTLFSEGIRSVVMLASSLYAYVALRALHRGRLSHFEFGIGKFEQFVNTLVGLGLIVSGLWIAQGVIATVLSTEPASTPFGLAMAAIVNAINALVNSVGWLGMVFAARDNNSDVFRVQIRARLIMMVSSLFLQITLTAAALARDDAIALLLDAAGATFVAGLMVVNGVAMLGRTLPDLADSPATSDCISRIRSAAEDILPATAIERIRTRRSGDIIFVEVAVTGATWTSRTRFQEAADRIVEMLDAQRIASEVTMTVSSKGDAGAVLV